MENLILFIPGLLLLGFTFYVIYNVFFHPLAHIPGPFFSKFSSIPFLFRFLSGYEYKYDSRLFKKYGPLVRVSPNVLVFAEPDYIPTVYNKDAWKGEKYNVAGPYGIFGIKSAKVHAERKRLLSNPFTTAAVKSYTPIVQKNVDFFLDALQQTFTTGQDKHWRTFDFSQWPSFFSYDVLTELAFGEPMGFVREQRDIGDMYATFEKSLYPLGAMIRTPAILSFLTFTGIWEIMKPTCRDKSGVGVIMRFAETMIQRRIDEPSHKRDILNQYLSNKTLLENRDILFSELLLLMIAGTDTVAIAIRCVLTNILHHPHVNAHLLSLIPGTSEYRTFITACIKESLRLAPPAQMPFSRVSPAQGYHLDSYYVPGNIEIYPSFHSINRSTRIWGADANTFKPERWLGYLNGTETWGVEKLRIMDLTFGSGSRMCLGKALAENELQLMFEGFWERFEFDGSKLEQLERIKVFNQMRFGPMPLGIRLRKRTWPMQATVKINDMEEK